MDNQALTPDTPMLQLDPETVENNEVADAVALDKNVAMLHGDAGWKLVSDEMREDIKALQNLRGADLKGQDMAAIGQKFLVASLVADHLQKYLDKVENAAKAVAEYERRSVKRET